MKRQKYYPARIDSQITWLLNFSAKLPGYETPLGLPSAHVDACVASCKYLVYVLQLWLPAVRTFGLAATEAADLLASGEGSAAVPLPVFTLPPLPEGVVAVPPGVLTPRLFALVALIKASPGYTDTIGLDLGIVGADPAVGTVPEVTAEVQAGDTCQNVALAFVKHGHTGVYVESKRGNGPWEFLATDTFSPYLDTRTLLVAGTPEVRQYRLRYWDKGEPVGEWSDIVTVTVAP
ncbi:MAG: hypothetical protein NT105_17515 [Verrucomicrobia bacterium]|nr:hypothetical protein [Verrucomicrobiota bacterium]